VLAWLFFALQALREHPSDSLTSGDYGHSLTSFAYGYIASISTFMCVLPSFYASFIYGYITLASASFFTFHLHLLSVSLFINSPPYVFYTSTFDGGRAQLENLHYPASQDP
jgi:hypothetical protein